MADPPGVPAAANNIAARQPPIGPTRVVVQTKTHLVPGDDYGDKIEGMRNMICQHVWGRNFIWGEDRWDGHGCQFGYDNRSCYFLVHVGMTADYGETSTDDPEILLYQWTGDTFLKLAGPLPPRVHSHLKRHPFTKPPKRGQQQSPPGPPISERELILSKLRLKMEVFDYEIKSLKERPDDVKWIKDKAEPRFWAQLEALGVQGPEEAKPLDDHPGHGQAAGDEARDRT